MSFNTTDAYDYSMQNLQKYPFKLQNIFNKIELTPWIPPATIETTQVSKSKAGTASPKLENNAKTIINPSVSMLVTISEPSKAVPENKQKTEALDEELQSSELVENADIIAQQVTGIKEPLSLEDDIVTLDIQDSLERSTTPNRQKTMSKIKTKQKKSSLKIENYDFYESNVYIGTSDGQIFRIVFPEIVYGSEEASSYQELGRVLVGSGDSSIYWYRLPDLKLLKGPNLPFITGVNCLSVDQLYNMKNTMKRPDIATICITKKKQLEIYEIDKNISLKKEIRLPLEVVTICHSGRYACIADIKSYKIIDLNQQYKPVELAVVNDSYKDPISSKIVKLPRPKIIAIGTNEFFYIVTSSMDASCIGCIVSETGESRKATIQFLEFPKSIAFSSPNLYTILADDSIQIHNVNTEQNYSVKLLKGDKASKPRKILSTNSFPIFAIHPIDFNFGNHSRLAPSDVNQYTLDNNNNVVYSRDNSSNPNIINNMYSEKISVLFNNSINILTKPSTFIIILNFLDQNEVEKAMSITERMVESSSKNLLQTPEVQYLYQRAALIYFKNLLFSDTIECLLKGKFDPRALIHLYKDISILLGTLIEPLSELHLQAHIKKLLDELGDIDKLIKNISESFFDKNNVQLSSIYESYYNSANDLLVKYLELTTSAYTDKATTVVINTALLILYVKTNQKDVTESHILRNHQIIDYQIAKGYLLEQKKYYYAGLIFKCNGNSNKYLDLYEQILSGEITDSDFTGELEYIDYLKSLKNEQILVEKFYKLFDINVELSIKIFILISPGAVAGLNTDSLIFKIEKSSNDNLLRLFIERLIAVHHSKSPLYTTLLAQIYIRDIKRYFLLPESNHHKKELEDAFTVRKNQNQNLTFREFLVQMSEKEKILIHMEKKSKQSRKNQNSSCIANKQVFFCDYLNKNLSENFFDSVRMRCRLIELITEHNQLLDIAKIIETITQHAESYLSIERAILLLKLGKVTEAISILVHEAQEFVEAEMICLTPKSAQSLFKLVYPVNNSEKGVNNKNKTISSICEPYPLILFQEYLKVEDPETAYLLVVDLITKYSDKYDFKGVLEKIPETWLALPFASYLKANFNALSSQTEFALITSGLLAPIMRSMQKDYYSTLSSPIFEDELINSSITKKENTIAIISKAQNDILSHYKANTKNLQAIKNSQPLKSDSIIGKKIPESQHFSDNLYKSKRQLIDGTEPFAYFPKLNLYSHISCLKK
ncbi:hypothetical protein BB561_003355 [Smittium simulii]|uniref:CNH domain-containing protein n=1 Tax=Smittium simulii TaxID=133385 RepID=A0A2T9YLU3_9FUNG|nr:hypothetical protein BB561_003355 [Smittium simulii]